MGEDWCAIVKYMFGIGNVEVFLWGGRGLIYLFYLAGYHAHALKESYYMKDARCTCHSIIYFNVFNMAMPVLCCAFND